MLINASLVYNRTSHPCVRVVRNKIRALRTSVFRHTRFDLQSDLKDP